MATVTPPSAEREREVDPLSVACTLCGSGPDDPCKFDGDVVQPHELRISAACVAANNPAPVSPETAGGGDGWRCADCNCLNQGHESFCFRCGAGAPDEHAVYADPVGGGWDGYRAACHDCSWTGTHVWQAKSAALLDAQRHKLPAAAPSVPAGDEQEEAHLAAVVAMHRRELLAFGQYAAIVHPEDLPVDYRPGMKLVEWSPVPAGGDELAELLTSDEAVEALLSAQRARPLPDHELGWHPDSESFAVYDCGHAIGCDLVRAGFEDVGAAGKWLASERTRRTLAAVAARLSSTTKGGEDRADS